ncbi:MAG: response regulator [Nitrospirota bacterium]|nr:response regulator [Nitrospirota bacterium]
MSTGPKKTVFVVDDEESIRLFLREELVEEGYDVTTFPNGEEVLTVLESGRPDLLLLDIRMPGIDGIKVLQRAKQKYPDLPVILCSAYSDYKHDFGAWSADGYFVKSARLDGLKEMIREVLERKPAG